MANQLTKQQLLDKLRQERPFLAEKYGVARLALYGSFAQGSQTEESDVDLLVQLMRPLGLEFIDLAYHLEAVVGRKVDLTTFDTLTRNLETRRYKKIATNVQRTLIYV